MPIYGPTPLRVVIDCETTGFGKSDRIIEFAATTIDSDGSIVEEFDTLINPERDTGPVHVHGVTASMVRAAPTFAEIANAVVARIHGAVLVAHNLPFDTRMLSQEFNRVGINFHPGRGVCTQALTRQKLEVACRVRGIGYTNQHAALADARATAELLRCIAPGRSGAPATAGPFDANASPPRTVSRHTVSTQHPVRPSREW